MIAGDDRNLDVRMGRLLQIGVLVSAAVMAAGGALYLVQRGSELPHYHTFRGTDAALRAPAAILRGVAAFRADSIMQLAVLLIIATPVMRVLFAVWAFARRRDWLYTAISATVLALLAFGIFFER